MQTKNTDVRTQLNAIFNEEKTLIRIPLEKARIALFDREKKTMELLCGSRSFSIPMRGAVIQYLGRAAWGKADWKTVEALWRTTHDDILKSAIETGLQHTNLQLLLRPGTLDFYGLAPSNFIAEEQSIFRDTLQGSLAASGLFEPQAALSGINKEGEIWEIFNLQAQPENRMAKSLMVIYGLNNGLSSYRFFFLRKIISCTNQLNLKQADLRRKHNDPLSPQKFMDQVLMQSLDFGVKQEQAIAESIGRPLQREEISAFFGRLHAPESVKYKLHQQLKQEVRAEGLNEFALSQAMTYLGTHTFGKGRDPHHAGMMRTGGSLLLDQPLTGVLEAPVQTVHTEYGAAYDWLLPQR